jgi:hypothetical protein
VAGSVRPHLHHHPHGIADLLAGGPMTAARLAQATQAHERSLYRVLRLLASLGVLAEHDGRSFSLTILGERLRSGVPASMRSWAMLVESPGGVRAFEPIVETVRTGKPGVDIAHGMSIFEFLPCHPELAPGFHAAMSERTAAFAPSVAAGYDFSPMRTVADIGGGKGTLLAAILRAHGHLRGVLVDLPPVVADAAGVFRAAGVADRCQIVPGDFFRGSRRAPTATSWPTCCTTGMTQIRCGSWAPAAGPWPKTAGC